MGLLSVLPVRLADATSASAAGGVMHAFIDPVVATMCVLASLACVLFISIGGYHYMTSSGNPDSLEHAKKIIRNAIIGLVLVLGAAVLTALLSHAYGAPGGGVGEKVPTLVAIQPKSASSPLVDVLIKAVVGFCRNIIESIADPFMKALNYFTSGTPLMAANASVFKLWLAVVGITDALFVLVVALLGFHVMSFASFGFDEIEFKHLLPQIGLMFLLMNTSIFAIDAVISLSNAMIHAINAVFPTTTVWDTLSQVSTQSAGLGLAALLIMIVFFVLAIILLVYYVGRLVTLYLGAVLSPLVCLLWLVPGFKDFVETAIKVYLFTIFVLFIHVVILQLAASIFAGLIAGSPDHTPDPIMALVVGLATVIALLKTQGVLMQLSYVSVGPRTARKLGGQFINGMAYLGSRGGRVAKKATSSGSDSSGSGDGTGGKRATAPASQSGPNRMPTGSTRPAPQRPPSKGRSAAGAGTSPPASSRQTDKSTTNVPKATKGAK